MRMTYEQSVQGRPVVDASGHVIGNVDQLVLESESLRITGFMVKLHAEAADAIGAEHGLFRAAVLDVPSEAIQSVSDTVVLRVDAASLVPRVPEPRR